MRRRLKSTGEVRGCKDPCGKIVNMMTLPNRFTIRHWIMNIPSGTGVAEEASRYVDEDGDEEYIENLTFCSIFLKTTATDYVCPELSLFEAGDL